jgi:ferritin-like metal-binding protein YciE
VLSVVYTAAHLVAKLESGETTMAKQSQDLRAFFLEELRDVYDAEKQLVKALPRMAKAASNDELKEAITEHLEVTKGHVQRIEQCFEHLDQKPRSKPCKGLKGILDEGKEALEEDLEEAVRDAAIAAGGRKVEHYEMVAYESLRGIAEQLELEEVAELLGETLEEEQEADQTLTEICQRIVEEAASGAGMEEEEEKGRARSGRGAAGNGGRARAATTRQGTGSLGLGERVLTDHDEIRQWAGEREATPACVKGTMKRDGSCMLRLDLPGYTGEDTLERISWDQWLQVFDNRSLALIVQDRTAAGRPSNFNKLVSRDAVQSKERPKVRSAH